MGELSRVSTDDRLIEMWLHGRCSGTQANYRRSVAEFQALVGKPLTEMRLEDLQQYAAHLSDRKLSEATRRNKINAVKSLFTFAAKLQYIRFNTAAALRGSKGSTTLAGRILRKDQVRLLVAFHPICKFMYATGVRVSEACGLTWGDLQVRDGGKVQARILGKGNKERIVLVPAAVWAELSRLRGDRLDSDPVFWHGDRQMNRHDAHRIVKAAVAGAGLDSKISAHWFRHAMASHSLAGGAPLELVRDTLGHSNISVTNVYLESCPDDSASMYLGL